MKHHNIISSVLLGALALAGVPLCSSSFVVTNTNDSGAGSLRQAITNANMSNIVPCFITFNIPGSGVQVIQPATPLPAITQSYVLIDGTTQPGWTQNTPLIQLDGSLLTPGTADGIALSGASNCAIQGLVISNGFANGVNIVDSGGVGSAYNVVRQCCIGTDPTGTFAQPNVNGVSITASTNDSNDCNVIGGVSMSDGNVISGNSGAGIALTTNIYDTMIAHNMIGSTYDGSAGLGNAQGGIVSTGSLTLSPVEQNFGTIIQNNLIVSNGIGGIILNANNNETSISNNTIGLSLAQDRALANDVGIVCQGQVASDISNPLNGTVNLTSITGNVIAGNGSDGIQLGANAINTVVTGNAIGTNSMLSSGLGNGGNGVHIQGVADAPVTNSNIGSGGANTIAGNGGYGVLLDGDVSTPDILNFIVQNSIFENGSDGINLQNNSNDDQIPPTINAAFMQADGSAIIVVATAPYVHADYQLDFFVNTSDSSPITEGQRWIGSEDIVTAGTTIVRFYQLSSPLMGSAWLSATATNLNNAGNTIGDTSEFAPNVPVIRLSTTVPMSMFQQCGQLP